MTPNFCAGTYLLGEPQKPYLLESEGLAKCAKGIQNAHSSKGQKPTHSPAREERHPEQETPLHYMCWYLQHFYDTLDVKTIQ